MGKQSESSRQVPEAWVRLPDEGTVREARKGTRSPYDFGVIPPMGRLLMAHPRIGTAFGRLFSEVMFQVERLSRSEAELVAAVAAAAQDCHY